MPAPTHNLRLAIAHNFAVDASAGVLRNLALMSGDREAKGHGLYIDDRTLETGNEAVAARGGQLKAAIRHGSWEEYDRNGGDRILEFPGFFSGISVKSRQLVAETFEFFQTFREESPAVFKRLIEMAAKTPGLFGLSIECWGYAVYVTEDGQEFGERPRDLALKYDGLPALRITDLSVAAFVDEPAANDGLFARAFSRLFGGKQTPAVSADAMREFAELCATWSKKHAVAALPHGDSPASVPPSAADRERLSAPAVFASPSSSNQPAPVAASRSETVPALDMNILAELQKKYAADPARLTRAFAALAVDTSLTVDKIEAALAAEDAKSAPAALSVSAIVTHFGAERAPRAFAILAGKPTATIVEIETALNAADAAELVKLRADKAKLETDLAAANKRHESLRNSGHPSALDLGVAGGKGAATQKELKGVNRVAAFFAADAKNPANDRRAN